MPVALRFLRRNKNSEEVSVCVGAAVPVQPRFEPLSTQSLLAVRAHIASYIITKLAGRGVRKG